MCHSFEGRGGSDAPSLDYMKGELTGGDIANMSGMIWNHVPMMKEAFAEGAHSVPRIHRQPDGQLDCLPPRGRPAVGHEDYETGGNGWRADERAVLSWVAAANGLAAAGFSSP
jgi:hypothetical protein